MAALLLRVLLNSRYWRLANRAHSLPESSTWLKQVNQLCVKRILKDNSFISRQLHRLMNNLILVSAGLNATLNTNNKQIQFNSGAPLSLMGTPTSIRLASTARLAVPYLAHRRPSAAHTQHRLAVQRVRIRKKIIKLIPFTRTVG
ncbi:MAG: Regulator of RpoS [Sodalis sp.]|nr:MAG: Regulator of RpoS [Sodalis sp.]